MRLIRTSLVLSALGAMTLLSGASSARAEVKACGNIFLTGDARCEWREKEACKTECTTETVETACVSKLYVACESGCMASASTTCESGCTETCTSQCDTQASADTPSCVDLCNADCKTTCSDGGGEVNRCCLHNCEARCERKCEGVPDVMEPAQCSESCTTACGGSCTAQANVQCQIDCQTNTYQECQTETVTTCETKCEQEGGAIFCDGQFVNAANAQDCADELKATFNFDIDVRAAAEVVGEAVEDGVEVTREGAKKTKSESKELCSVRAAGLGAGAGSSALFLVGLVGLAGARRRGRRER